MRNHWDRADWSPGRTAYYWYLTFLDEHVLQAMAAECQAVIRGAHFDVVPTSELHMTLERVEFSDCIGDDDLVTVQQMANQSLADIEPFEMTVGPLAGSAGALSFSALPRERLSDIRRRLVVAAHSAGYAFDVSPEASFRPHVGIAYCNRSIDARGIIEKVRALRTIPQVAVQVREVALVALTRNERSYSWESVHRVPLVTRN